MLPRPSMRTFEAARACQQARHMSDNVSESTCKARGANRVPRGFKMHMKAAKSTGPGPSHPNSTPAAPVAARLRSSVPSAGPLGDLLRSTKHAARSTQQYDPSVSQFAESSSLRASTSPFPMQNNQALVFLARHLRRCSRGQPEYRSDSGPAGLYSPKSAK